MNVEYPIHGMSGYCSLNFLKDSSPTFFCLNSKIMRPGFALLNFDNASLRRNLKFSYSSMYRIVFIISLFILNQLFYPLPERGQDVKDISAPLSPK